VNIQLGYLLIGALVGVATTPWERKIKVMEPDHPPWLRRTAHIFVTAFVWPAIVLAFLYAGFTARRR